MATFTLAVPGYAAAPSQGGPDHFNNVDGVAWTDVLGLRSATDIKYSGKRGLEMDFHFPFTTPIIFGTATPATSGRMRISSVAVTFFVRRAVPVSTVRVNRIRVFDRLNPIFDTLPRFGPLDMPELAGAPPGTGGRMEPNDAFMNSTRLDRNVHGITPPLPITKSIGVTVSVNFGDEGGLIAFTGAGILLE